LASAHSDFYRNQRSSTGPPERLARVRPTPRAGGNRGGPRRVVTSCPGSPRSPL